MSNLYTVEGCEDTAIKDIFADNDKQAIKLFDEWFEKRESDDFADEDTFYLCIEDGSIIHSIKRIS
jgi:hypothetical protein